jgi:lysophospholipase L1-like esterase
MESPQALSGWAQALGELSAGRRQTVSVCHIGDSHLQSGQVDAVLRADFQKRYGNAGRGYVFPYEALGTGNPPDLRSSVSGPLKLRRMMGLGSGGQVGPGGLAAVGQGLAVSLTVEVLDEEGSFDQERVLQPEVAEGMGWYAPDPEQPQQSSLLQWKTRRQKLSLYSGPGIKSELHGLILARAQRPGVFWHTLAANGAEARHFAGHREIVETVAGLAPDLMIVSLGTNETQQRGYNRTAALAQQQNLWTLLRQAAPQASLLIVAAPAARYRRLWSNPRLADYNEGLREMAERNGAAYFDLLAAQGGLGAYGHWAEAGLAGKDGVHYKPAGYQQMGQWLLQALRGAEDAHVP